MFLRFPLQIMNDFLTISVLLIDDFLQYLIHFQQMRLLMKQIQQTQANCLKRLNSLLMLNWATKRNQCQMLIENLLRALKQGARYMTSQSELMTSQTIKRLWGYLYMLWSLLSVCINKTVEFFNNRIGFKFDQEFSEWWRNI